MVEAAKVFDIATGERIAPPLAVAPDVVREDARGRYVLVDGQRIPVRNGGTLDGLSPLEDWQVAREVEQEIARGEAVDASAIGWRNLFGATLSVATSAGGWTTYTTTGEPGAVLWCAGAWGWALASPFVAFRAADDSMFVIVPWIGALLAWTWACMSTCESDASIRRKMARERSR